jgi:dTDP-4-dehydrorhamnose 3,5-epimerase
MQFIPTKIPDVLLIKPQVHGDERGFFMETYRESEFNQAGVNYPMVQENHSRSQQGVLRGMHYQVKHSQGKLVRMILGEAFDVCVDLRRSSPTYLQWVGVYLSAQNKNQVWIPPGFAHGFYVLSDWAEIIYKVTDYWAPEWERTLRWDDPDIAIDWPLLAGTQPLLSGKDRQGKFYRDLDDSDLYV